MSISHSCINALKNRIFWLWSDLTSKSQAKNDECLTSSLEIFRIFKALKFWIRCTSNACFNCENLLMKSSIRCIRLRIISLRRLSNVSKRFPILTRLRFMFIAVVTCPTKDSISQDLIINVRGCLPAPTCVLQDVCSTIIKLDMCSPNLHMIGFSLHPQL